MAHFLLIHGAWHGGWCFDRLHAPLAALGHSLSAPTLPGMDGKGRALVGATLARWAAFVVEQARALPGPLILGGHSRGGLVISEAAELAPELFSDLVYLSGALIPSGRTLYEILGADMEGGAFGAALSPVEDGLGLRFAAERAAGIFYNRCTPQDQSLASERLMVEPVRPLNTPLSLTEARYGRVPRHYIECEFDQCFPLAAQRAMQAALPCKSVATLAADHSPFLCTPDELAAALDNIAKERAI